LQIDLYSAEHAAIQYVQPVEDPRDVSEQISETVNELDRKLRSIQQDESISLRDAEVLRQAQDERSAFAVAG
jgi:hypothetical protein